MSVRFAIKNRADKIEKEGNVIVRYTGDAEPFSRGSERESKLLGRDEKGNPKLVFTTGLDEKQVKFFKWYNDDEKEVLLKEIKNLRPIISDFYGGEKVIHEGNDFFWKTLEVNKIKVTNEVVDTFFDTKHVPSALLYLSIAAGAFIDTIAPTKEWAERYQLPHYLVLETEDTFDEDGEITKSDAHGALRDLRRDASSEALFIIAWCIQYDTRDYGAYLKSTPAKDLIAYHIKYIDGKLNLKKKKNCPQVFLDYAEKWEGQKTRPLLYTEAYIKAGEYYNFIQKKEKVYTTIDGTALGNTVSEAVENIMKSANHDEYKKLRDSVEAKWKE